MDPVAASAREGRPRHGRWPSRRSTRHGGTSWSARSATPSARPIARGCWPIRSSRTCTTRRYTPPEPHGHAYELRSPRCPIRELDDAGARSPQRRRRPVPEPHRDAGDPGLLPRRWPRAARRRTRDDRPDLERALRAQDVPQRRHVRDARGRDGRGDPQPDQDDGLRGDGGAGQAVVPERVRGQRGRDRVRRRARGVLQGRDAQPPLGDRALRRGGDGHRRGRSRPDGHGPGRQAGGQHRRVLLRPGRHAAGRSCPRACCTRGG